MAGVLLGGAEGAKDGTTIGALVGAVLGAIYNEVKDAVTGTPASTSQQGAVDTSPMAAHSTGERESIRQGHEEGEARTARDRGGEKGDKAGTYPRKPPTGWKTGERGNKSGAWPPTNPRDQRIADGLMGR